MKLLVATTNIGKKNEFSSLFSHTDFELVFPNDLGLHFDVEENGSSYSENAQIKAETLLRHSGLITLADDTGLEVDALDGRPGLHSARYAAIPGATDVDRRAKLLSELNDKPSPWRARFFCAVALARPNQPIEYFTGEVKGEIINQERGENGFGYDKLFWIPELNKTMAELSMEEKNKYSHRAIAVNKVIRYLKECCSEPGTISQ